MTLYLSDLDGTLLDNNAALSEYTVSTINALIDSGLHFSVATARTPNSAKQILAPLHLRLPIVLLNGAAIYDTGSDTLTDVRYIDDEISFELSAVIRGHGLTPVVYTERGLAYYFIITGTHAETYALLKDAKHISGIAYTLFPNFYTDDEDSWLLEFYSAGVSKGTGARILKERYGYNKLIGFGDNLNDLPLFEACDKFYAPKNANPIIKSKAAAVIEPNTLDGVAKWLAANSKI